MTFVFLAGCGKSAAAVPPTPMPLQIPGMELPIATQSLNGTQTAPIAPVEEVIPSGDLYRPIDPAECALIHDNASAALNVSMGITEKSLSEFAAFGVYGGACMIRAKGTGAEFDLTNTLAKIEAAITAGWTPADKFRIDKPISVSRGYTKDNKTMVIGIGWIPASDANCPIEQILTCPLTPEQKVYRIVITVMQK